MCSSDLLALIEKEDRPKVWHQAGRRNITEAQQAYRQAGVDGRVDAYIDEMAEAYAWADLVICRAGALTIAELACAGVGSILVPYPHAVDDHQTKNAQYLVENHAATVVQQHALDAAWLVGMINGYLLPEQGRSKLLKMAEAARALGKPEATASVAAYCLEVANNGT